MHGNQTQPIHIHQNYAFYVMRPQHSEEVLEMTAKIFAQYCPVFKSIALLHPELVPFNEESTRRFWTVGLSEEASNGLSVIICDLSNKSQIVGVTLTKDASTPGVPEEVEAAFKDNIFNTPVKGMMLTMIEALSPEVKEEIGQLGRTIDINGVAIKREHTGKGLLSVMVRLSCSLAKAKGFVNGFCYAANAKTEAVMQKFGFERVGLTDASAVDYKGERVFSLIEKVDPHKYTSLWFKRGL